MTPIDVLDGRVYGRPLRRVVALYLDPHDARALTCPLMRWDGDPARCRWCDGPLPPRRRRWCSDECNNAYGRNHMWAPARGAALRRDGPYARDGGGRGDDGWRCAWPGCPGTAALRARGLTGAVEVDHIEPILGRHGEFGCHHHLEGLQTLHVVCHELKHHGARSRYAPRDEQLRIG